MIVMFIMIIMIIGGMIMIIGGMIMITQKLQRKESETSRDLVKSTLINIILVISTGTIISTNQKRSPTNSRRGVPRGQRQKSSCNILSPSESRALRLQTRNIILTMRMRMRTQTYQQKLKAHIKILTPLWERLLAATFGKFVSASKLSAMSSHL